MHICVILPAHNEAKYISDCLYSFVHQTRPPEELIVVDDNSTDTTYDLARGFAKDHSWIKVVQHWSSSEHLPGDKVIRAFNFGLEHATNDYDLIGKFDADIILPPNYFEKMRNHFQANWLLGMCSGVLQVEKNGKWIHENIANKNHIRGPIKLYYRQVFELMGGLRLGVGWDTVDTLLCQYHDFEVKTDLSLQVKHLRPTGHGYSTKNYRSKGEALYKMRYGLPLANLAVLKMAWQSKSPGLFLQGIFGYLSAVINRPPRFVNPYEGKFIRKYRFKGIFRKYVSK
ncbi:MAG: glycosyltransferase family 2 protein [Bacteroidota bacterium]